MDIEKELLDGDRRVGCQDSCNLGLAGLFPDCYKPRNFRIGIERSEELNPFLTYFLATVLFSFRDKSAVDYWCVSLSSFTL